MITKDDLFETTLKLYKDDIEDHILYGSKWTQVLKAKGIFGKKIQKEYLESNQKLFVKV